MHESAFHRSASSECGRRRPVSVEFHPRVEREEFNPPRSPSGAPNDFRKESPPVRQVQIEGGRTRRRSQIPSHAPTAVSRFCSTSTTSTTTAATAANCKKRGWFL